MRKSLSTLLLIAAAAIAISSCNKVDPQVHEPEDVNVAESTVFHITASAVETKSVFGEKSDNSYPTLWTTNKSVAFSRDEAAFVEGVPTLVNEGASATFDVELEGENTEGTIYAFSPLGVYDKENASNNVPGFTSINAKYHDVYLNIPSEQTPLANSVDESAQALVGTTEYSNGNVDLSINFSHVVAYGKMAITNFAGGDIASVEITFPVDVVGSSCWYYYTGEDAGTIDKLNGKTITLDPTNVVDNTFWFALAPTEGKTGNMIISVTDVNDDTYTKTIDLTKKALPFVKGQVSSFTANFSGIETEHFEAVIPDGNYAILAKDGDTYYAVSSNANGTSTRRDRVAVTYNGGTSFETSNTDLIWTFTASTDAYTIANGTDYMGAAKNTIPLKLVSDAAKVTIVENGDGTFTLTADCGADGTRYMAMNGTNGFGWYAETTGTHNLYLVPAVIVEPTYYSIIVNSASNGLIAASKPEAQAGEKITLTATPAVGYQFASWSVKDASDNDVTVTDNAFTMPASDVTVSATFEQSEGGQGGSTKTYQHVFNKKPELGNNIPLSNVNWNITATSLGAYNSGNYAGVQIGSKSADGEIKLTSSSAWSYDGATKVKEVRVWLNTGGVNNVTPTVTIGGVSAISDGTNVVKNSTAGSDWTKATKVTFTPGSTNTGVIVIDVTTVAPAGYICAIEIDCE